MARDMVNTLQRVYCFENGICEPEDLEMCFYNLVPAACENGLVVARVLSSNEIILYLPNGEEYIRGEKSQDNWKSETARERLVSSILQDKIGQEFDLWCEKYQHIPECIDYVFKLKTDFMAEFYLKNFYFDVF